MTQKLGIGFSFHMKVIYLGCFHIQTSKIRSQLHYYTVNYMSITARIELPNCFLVLDKEYFGISSNSNSTKRLYSVPTFFASI